MNRASAAAAGRIGPNAILQVDEALAQGPWSAWRVPVFKRAGLQHHLLDPPQQMVPQDEVRRLHLSLRETLGPAVATTVATDAGRRTAAYLLAHRIPRPVQWLLKRLPAHWAAPVLLKAITANAWTFVGTGRFRVLSARGTHPVLLSIEGNPLCVGLQADAPACAFYAATFETLCRALVHPTTAVREWSCEAMGHSACCFELRWVSATVAPMHMK
ncbi:MAG: bacteriochlorophyll 4-vinyl reductase [Rubrivivax sp.]|jgi:divinyl protochlorophyllide a 8-vinyl-reductase|nr:bacteriochlorophyll 4-vinyl reductase [Rubrivivax sp.]